LSDAETRPRSALYVHGIALVGIFFFGLGIFILLKKLFDARPGLEFTPTGIVDNSNGIAVGFVPWSEITGFEIGKVRSTKFLIVKLTHPQKYLAKRGWMRRAFSQATLNMCGTPLALSSTALAIDFDKLVDLFGCYLRKYGLRQGPG
jgi:hypothetical protein